MKSLCAVLLLFAATPLSAQDATTVLNRYVQVTGGADLYKRFNSEHFFYTVTKADKSTSNVDYFHTRDGKSLIETDTGTATLDEGVSEGIAWKYSEAKGAQLLKGKQAARALADATGFDEDDWHLRYPTVKLAANQTINGAVCHHVVLTRIDGSTIDRFYEVKTGLLVRETGTNFDDAGNEQPVTTDFERYDTFFGIRRTVAYRIKAGTQTMEIQMNNVAYSVNAEAANFELPHDVVRAIVASRNKNSSLPNPVDLIDKFVAATGGKAAYENIKTEVIKAEVSFQAENLKFPVVTYTAGGRQYSAADMPSMGKFESGDDGRTGWERSVVMGPKLRPHSSSSDFMGPQPGEVLKWSEAAVNMQTVSQDQVNGTPCYLVRLGDKANNSSTACFDTKTGLLLKTTSPPDADGQSEQTYSDYRRVNGIVICYHIETKVAGHDANVQITGVAINDPVPAGIFDLPPDVKALKAKRDAAVQAVPAAPGAPTLKHPVTPQ